jgi:hypothetical protein
MQIFIAEIFWNTLYILHTIKIEISFLKSSKKFPTHKFNLKFPTKKTNINLNRRVILQIGIDTEIQGVDETGDCRQNYKEPQN